MKFLEFVDRNNELCGICAFFVLVLLIVNTVMFYNGREDARRSAERIVLINNGYEEKPTTYTNGYHWEKR